MVSPSNFELFETTIPPMKEGNVLGQVLCISFDAALQMWASVDTYMPKSRLGEPM